METKPKPFSENNLCEENNTKNKKYTKKPYLISKNDKFKQKKRRSRCVKNENSHLKKKPLESNQVYSAPDSVPDGFVEVRNIEEIEFYFDSITSTLEKSAGKFKFNCFMIFRVLLIRRRVLSAFSPCDQSLFAKINTEKNNN